jgi:selenoprotein W-related protein
VGLANELLKRFEPEIENLVLVPSDGGRYEISVNGKLVFSKLQTGRHAEAAEIASLIEQAGKI